MQWETWLELFHPEGRYWLPLEWAQEDPVLQPSLIHEGRLQDRILLRPFQRQPVASLGVEQLQPGFPLHRIEKSRLPIDKIDDCFLVHDVTPVRPPISAVMNCAQA